MPPTIYERLEAAGKLNQITITQTSRRLKSFYIPEGLWKENKNLAERKYREYLKNCCPKKYQKLLVKDREKCRQYLQNLSEEQRAKMNERKRISQRKRLFKNSCYQKSLETKRKYREKNKDKINEYQREYRQKIKLQKLNQNN